MTSLTTGQAIVESLLLHEVDTVFGIPGAHTYDLFDALHAEGDRIRFITTRHEQARRLSRLRLRQEHGQTGRVLRRAGS